MTDLTVIVPAYNAQEHVATFAESAKRNLADGIKFIVVDDHSTDATPRLLDEAARRISGITVIRNDENVGVARSRNIAHALVDTRYVTYVDIDDWCAPGHLAQAADAAAQLDVDFVRFDHVRVDRLSRTVVRAPESRVWEPYAAAEGIGSASQRTMVDYPFLWAGIYDTTRIAPELFVFDERLRTAADRPWFWRLYLNTHSTARADLRGYFYRKTRNPAALTQAGNRSTLHFLPASESIADLVLASGDPALVAKAAYQAVRMIEFHLSARGRLNRALQLELFAGAHQLMARYPKGDLEVAIREFNRPTRVLLRRVRRLRSTHA
ncbi:glycosyltransferase family 2 protein [Demequina sp.]|uniref:glycosyltransferase family 2 protein n=1 Tax=Demequina sp. TaxID=2050685 RepID=UPI003A8BDB9A